MLIVFDDAIVDMEANKKLSPVVTDVLLRGRKLNISHFFISQSYFKVPKIPNKRKIEQIASNHSSDIEFKDFEKL